MGLDITQCSNLVREHFNLNPVVKTMVFEIVYHTLINIFYKGRMRISEDCDKILPMKAPIPF